MLGSPSYRSEASGTFCKPIFIALSDVVETRADKFLAILRRVRRGTVLSG